jgi:exonuclease V
MAGPATIPTSIEISLNDVESDYGSDFSPEEELIVAQLLSQNATEDNPVVNDVEYHESKHTLRIPRLVEGKDSPWRVVFDAAKAAEKVAEQINEAVADTLGYPDCKASPALICFLFLTDAEASSR